MQAVPTLVLLLFIVVPLGEAAASANNNNDYARALFEDQAGIEDRTFWLGVYASSLAILLLLWKLPWSLKVLVAGLVVACPVYLYPATVQMLFSRYCFCIES